MEHGLIDRTLRYEQREIEEFEKEHGGVGSVESSNDRRDKASKMKERSQAFSFSSTTQKSQSSWGCCFVLVGPRFGPMRRALKQGWRPIEGSTRFHEWRKNPRGIETLRKKRKRKERK